MVNDVRDTVEYLHASPEVRQQMENVYDDLPGDKAREGFLNRFTSLDAQERSPQFRLIRSKEFQEATPEVRTDMMNTLKGLGDDYAQGEFANQFTYERPGWFERTAQKISNILPTAMAPVDSPVARAWNATPLRHIVKGDETPLTKQHTDVLQNPAASEDEKAVAVRELQKLALKEGTTDAAAAIGILTQNPWLAGGLTVAEDVIHRNIEGTEDQHRINPLTGNEMYGVDTPIGRLDALNAVQAVAPRAIVAGAQGAKAVGRAATRPAREYVEGTIKAEQAAAKTAEEAAQEATRIREIVQDATLTPQQKMARIQGKPEPPPPGLSKEELKVWKDAQIEEQARLKLQEAEKAAEDAVNAGQGKVPPQPTFGLQSIGKAGGISAPTYFTLEYVLPGSGTAVGGSIATLSLGRDALNHYLARAPWFRRVVERNLDKATGRITLTANQAKALDELGETVAKETQESLKSQGSVMASAPASPHDWKIEQPKFPRPKDFTIEQGPTARSVEHPVQPNPLPPPTPEPPTTPADFSQGTPNFPRPKDFTVETPNFPRAEVPTQPIADVAEELPKIHPALQGATDNLNKAQTKFDSILESMPQPVREFLGSQAELPSMSKVRQELLNQGMEAGKATKLAGSYQKARTDLKSMQNAFEKVKSSVEPPSTPRVEESTPTVTPIPQEELNTARLGPLERDAKGKYVPSTPKPRLTPEEEAEMYWNILGKPDIDSPQAFQRGIDTERLLQQEDAVLGRLEQVETTPPSPKPPVRLTDEQVKAGIEKTLTENTPSTPQLVKTEKSVEPSQVKGSEFAPGRNILREQINNNFLSLVEKNPQLQEALTSFQSNYGTPFRYTAQLTTPDIPILHSNTITNLLQVVTKEERRLILNAYKKASEEAGIKYLPNGTAIITNDEVSKVIPKLGKVESPSLPSSQAEIPAGVQGKLGEIGSTPQKRGKGRPRKEDS